MPAGNAREAAALRGTRQERVRVNCGVLGAMPTLAVGMFSRENRCMATQAWPWHPLRVESGYSAASIVAFIDHLQPATRSSLP